MSTQIRGPRSRSTTRRQAGSEDAGSPNGPFPSSDTQNRQADAEPATLPPEIGPQTCTGGGAGIRVAAQPLTSGNRPAPTTPSVGVGSTPARSCPISCSLRGLPGRKPPARCPWAAARPSASPRHDDALRSSSRDPSPHVTCSPVAACVLTAPTGPARHAAMTKRLVAWLPATPRRMPSAAGTAPGCTDPRPPGHLMEDLLPSVQPRKLMTV
jgi:hypothetical protein